MQSGAITMSQTMTTNEARVRVKRTRSAAPHALLTRIHRHQPLVRDRLPTRAQETETTPAKAPETEEKLGHKVNPPRPPKKSVTEPPQRWLEVEKNINDEGMIVVAHVAPSVRVVICEALGYGVGHNMEKQLVRGLRNLGFDYVFDTMFTADLTIIEEGHELIKRIRDKLIGSEEADKHPMPMFTSCCPGWIQLAEKSYPELLPHISTCKSPQMMMGAVVKTFFAEQLGVPPSKIKVVSIMPCVRKQPEADRDLLEFRSAAVYARQAHTAASESEPSDMEDAPLDPVFQDPVGDIVEDSAPTLPCPVGSEACAEALEQLDESIVEDPIVACDVGPHPSTITELGAVRDLDHVLTTLEIARVFEMKGIDLRVLPHSDFDVPLGVGAGAGQLFGSTGGVMEAALRTAYELITGTRLERVEFEEVRGLEAIRMATVELTPSESGPLGAAVKAAGVDGSLALKVAVVNGLGTAKKVAAAVCDGSMDVDFVEIMACPGGCIGGGGNPRATHDVLKQRQFALYTVDERKEVRRSHENPMIQILYSRFLGEPGGHKAHDLLHTHYVPGGPPSIAGKE